MLYRLLTPICIALGASSLGGCTIVQYQYGSANIRPIVDQFPLQGKRPLARELRYTYTYNSVIGGKTGKPLFGADAATRADPAAPTPVAILAAASQPLPRGSDALSREADQRARRGEVGQVQVARRGAAAEMAAAEASIGRAQATAAALYSTVSAMEQMARVWTQQTADVLGNWIRRNTSAIGADAPEGSVMRLDFIYIINGARFQSESRSDVLVTASLADGRGRFLQSRQAYQVYNYGRRPGPELPSDAVPIDVWVVPPEKRDLIQPLFADGWTSIHLAIAANAAIGDLYRQLESQ